jgi:hypothetical protein
MECGVCMLTACLLALGVELAQSSADSTKINPNECGLTFKQANRLIRKQKRLTKKYFNKPNSALFTNILFIVKFKVV